MTTAYIVDTETNAIDNPDVIELAWLEVTPQWEGGEFFLQRYATDRRIDYGAMAVHHIVHADMAGKPPTYTARDDLPPMAYMIGHNIDFDWKALGQPPVKRICTLALARNLWPKLDSHSLTVLMYAKSADEAAAREKVKNAHSAEVDVRNNLFILQHIIAELQCPSFERLWELSEDARIPRVMAFGKFKGQPISAVDKGYVRWYLQQPDTDPYLIEAFCRAGLAR